MTVRSMSLIAKCTSPEEDGLILVDTRAERPEYCTIKGTLPAGTKLQEAEKIAHRGFSFWWHFGPYSHVDVYGEILDGDFKGILVDFGEYRQCCPKHGYWYLCPLDCPDRNLKCLTPEKYDQKHILNSNGMSMHDDDEEAFMQIAFDDHPDGIDLEYRDGASKPLYHCKCPVLRLEAENAPTTATVTAASYAALAAAVVQSTSRGYLKT